MSDPDILDRLKRYEEFGPLSSVSIHPETPGYSTGRLFGDARLAASEIKRLRVQAQRTTCEWKPWEHDCGTWQTSCGDAFMVMEGTPGDSGMRFCCYCGGTLKEVAG